MTEDEARQWIRERFGVSRETMLSTFVERVIAEAAHQNLLSASSIPAIWDRHIVDSAQLVSIANAVPGPWIDIGTGAGFPGIVAAILSDLKMVLIEPRRRRADFLTTVVMALGLENRVTVEAKRAEQVTADAGAGIISARAVAALPELLAAGLHLARRNTLWLLPKGKTALEEVAAARETWHGSFHVEHSITEPGSLIIIARDVARR